MARLDIHHELIKKGIEIIHDYTTRVGGQLGRHTDARYRAFIRIQSWLENNKNSLFETEVVKRIHEELYNFPLQEYARDVISRELKSGIDDDKLIELIASLREDGSLSLKNIDNNEIKDPRIICSMGLRLS